MRTLAVFALRWLVIAVSAWVAAKLVPGIHLEGVRSTLIVSLVLGMLNVFIKPILVFVTLPITILTLGLFLLVINTLLLLMTAWLSAHFDVQFSINGFVAAFLGALVITVVSFVLTHVLKFEGIA